MYRQIRVYPGCLSNIWYPPVKITATFFLISSVVLHSPFSNAEQKTSAFQNIINKVSRSGSLMMLQAVCDRGKAEIKNDVARCSACPSFTSASGDKTGFALADVVLGSFTQAREPEALLYMKGCESEAKVDSRMFCCRRQPMVGPVCSIKKGLVSPNA